MFLPKNLYVDRKFPPNSRKAPIRPRKTIHPIKSYQQEYHYHSVQKVQKKVLLPGGKTSLPKILMPASVYLEGQAKDIMPQLYTQRISHSL